MEVVLTRRDPTKKGEVESKQHFKMDDGGGHPYAYELHPPQPTLKYAEQSLTQQPDFPQFVQLMSAAVLGSLSTVVLDSPSCACIQIKMV